MNKLEEALSAGIIDAHNVYGSMSGGSWLQHAPEYFLTTALARKIFEYTGRFVYMDVSPNRIQKQDHNSNENIEGNNIRPDITVWDKKGHWADSCIEIKTNKVFEGVPKDIERLDFLFAQDQSKLKSAYVIAYCTHKKEDSDYRSEFSKWQEQKGWLLINQYFGQKHSEGWLWAFAILKHPRSKNSF